MPSSFQPLFGAGIRSVRGHYRFSMDVYSTSPPDITDRQMRAAVNAVQHLAGDLTRLGEIERAASAMSLALEICPRGDSVRKNSLGLCSLCSGVSTTPGSYHVHAKYPAARIPSRGSGRWRRCHPW